MIKAKKSLGQNFLKSNDVIEKIIKTADLKSDDVILEVGPGKGFLTKKLLEQVKKVIAIEKDHRLIEFLQEKFKDEIKNGKLELIYGDILKIESLKTCLPAGRLIENCKLKIENYKVVANIPYYITGQFLRKFLSTNFQPSKIVVMLQKEVAQRIAVQEGKESIMSLSVKAYGKPKYIETVIAENFFPQPKIDSAILLIDDISKDFFNKVDEKSFFQVVKMGFSNKRKKLVNNISLASKEKLEQIFKDLKIPLKTRAENLSLEDWRKLVKVLNIPIGN